MSEPLTRIDSIGDDLYRISTAMGEDLLPGGFTFNQYLLIDESPLLFHTGPGSLFDAVASAIATILPVSALRYVGFCHVEADECGSLNRFLEAAPAAEPLCGVVANMTSISDLAVRAARTLADGEQLSLGRHTVEWIDAPHVPHGWENGFLFEHRRRTLFCGDLFTQGGSAHAPVVPEVLEASERMRRGMDYFAHGPATLPTLERLARLDPVLLACMHGSACNGDAASQLRALAGRLQAETGPS